MSTCLMKGLPDKCNVNRASGVGRSSARNQEIRGAGFSQNGPDEAAAKRFIARYNIQRVLEPPPMPPGKLAPHYMVHLHVDHILGLHVNREEKPCVTPCTFHFISSNHHSPSFTPTDATDEHRRVRAANLARFQRMARENLAAASTCREAARAEGLGGTTEYVDVIHLWLLD